MNNYRILTKEQMKENEKWFTRILNSLNEGGIYAFPEAKQLYIKRGNKLVCSQGGYNAVVPLVSKEYLKNNFDFKK